MAYHRQRASRGGSRPLDLQCDPLGQTPAISLRISRTQSRPSPVGSSQMASRCRPSSRGSSLILAWNGTGRYNPADCNHCVSFRRWHFPCKKRKLSEARHRGDIPGKSSRWVPVTFPGSGVRLSCDEHSKPGSGLPIPYRSGKAQSRLTPQVAGPQIGLQPVQF